MKTTLVVCMTIVALAWLAPAWTAPAAEDPSEKLSESVGRWEIEWTWNAQGESARQLDTRILRECRWAPQGHDYLICSMVMTSATMGNHRRLSVLSYDPNEKNYVVVAIANPGMRPMAPQTLNIQGNTWTEVTEIKYAGKSTQTRSTTDWLAPDRATLKSESSDDGGAHWRLTASGTEKKIGD